MSYKEVTHNWVEETNKKRGIAFEECKACGVIRFGNNGSTGYISPENTYNFMTTTKEINIENNPLPCTGEVKYLVHWMLKGKMRDYVINKIKAPLQKIIEIIGGRLPEITRESLLQPNSHILFDLRDEFLKHENNRTKRKLFEAAWNILIAIYEHDNYYRYRFDWLLEEISKSNWTPRLADSNKHWKEDND